MERPLVPLHDIAADPKPEAGAVVPFGEIDGFVHPRLGLLRHAGPVIGDGDDDKPEQQVQPAPWHASDLVTANTGIYAFMRTALLSILLLTPVQALRGQVRPVELSLGWNYAYDDQGDGFTNANGWYGTANWALFKRVGLTFSHESYWGAYRGLALNQHVYLGGFTFKLRRKEHPFKPFLQPFGGVTRASYAGTIEHQPTFELAAGADIRMKGNLSFEIIPAEYAYASGGTGALHNYQAGAGIEYTFQRKKR